SSFGFGGANAHVVLEEFPGPGPAVGLPTLSARRPSDPSRQKGGPQLIVLSAKTRERLIAYAGALSVFIRASEGSSEAHKGKRRPDPAPIREKLLSWTGDLLDVAADDLDPGETLASMGLDPVGLAALAEKVNEEWQADFSAPLFTEYPTILRLTEYLCASIRDGSAVQNADSLPTSDGPVRPPELADIAYTLQTGREAMTQRLALAVSDTAELREKLDRFTRGETGIDGCYTGDADTDGTGAGMLLDGPEGADYLRTVLKERKIHKLARLWVSGADIDWDRLHPDGPLRRRLSLPTYPFAKERYWADGLSALQGDSRGGFHPLIDGIDSTRSTGEGMVFRKTLRPDIPLVRDHRVGGRSIMPGTGFLEMALATGRVVLEGRRFRIGRMVWRRPLEIADRAESVRIAVTRSGGHYLCRMESRRDDRTILYATAEFHPTEESPPDAHIDVREIRSRCTREISGGDLYRRFQDAGIHYGPYFQGVDRVWVGEGEALGRIRLPAPHRHELGRYSLHPGFLDAALQTFMVLLPKAGKAPHLLPYAVEWVEMLHPPADPGFAHVESEGPNRFHLVLSDKAGRVCAKLTHVALRPVPDLLENTLFKVSWFPLSTEQVSVESDGAAKTAPMTGRLLVVSSEESLELEQALLARREPGSGTVIRLGSRNRSLSDGVWEIDTFDASALDRAVKRIGGVERIWFLGGIVPGPMNPDDPDVHARVQERGVMSLFRLIQALDRHDRIRGCSMLGVVTHNVHGHLNPRQGSPMPSAGGLSGLARGIGREYPDLAVSVIDVGDADLERLAEDGMLPPPLASRACEVLPEEVAVYGGRCYVRRVEPFRLPPVSDSPFRERGVYLVLGGAGGIGLVLSQYLANTVNARLALVGRRDLGDRQKRRIARIEASGGEVLYIRADATDPKAMHRAVETAVERFGALHGVIHSALVLEDRAIRNMDEETLRAVMAPKVEGSIHLSRAVAGMPLDFMMFFSAAQSIFCNAGQSNYAAACTFKDA
ncbi:MAG: SDR family NAD(P)-dependent oxidoreductase, partial [Desulfobacteraceae bacterium]|nr:SDR family NAD(P)-dependent oxidoreductase [Desulfobacteraceae bacterium]